MTSFLEADLWQICSTIYFSISGGQLAQQGTEERKQSSFRRNAEKIRKCRRGKSQSKTESERHTVKYHFVTRRIGTDTKSI